MNWIDFALIILLLLGVWIGVKRGLISGIAGFLGLLAGVNFSVNWVDAICARFLSHMRVSPLMIAFFALIIVFLLAYLAMKLLGYLFYKMASPKPLGNIDKVGGGILGAAQAWVVLGMVLILLIFLPMPQSFKNAVNDSSLGPMVRGSIPFTYEEMAFTHPLSTSFVQKMKNALEIEPVSKSKFSLPIRNERVKKAIAEMEEYFGE
jgi:uncharacterized membrane protein required for colicin V production